MMEPHYSAACAQFPHCILDVFPPFPIAPDAAQFPRQRGAIERLSLQVARAYAIPNEFGNRRSLLAAESLQHSGHFLIQIKLSSFHDSSRCGIARNASENKSGIPIFQ
jgi:hypothetical protein